ncbi:DUF1403 family protein [Citreicella sp. C3M06]|uniref:DUF1403 family protein n=1 Tax=Citreicella sp. C3M06 TaxID=2841564 RepID=UPI002091183A|nr:DUF1403 family protein [Citreicella sp. C3M06]
MPRAMPGWLPGGGQDIEAAGFSSGAALMLLHLTLQVKALPDALLRERLSLRAAQLGAAMTGRREQAAEIRDEIMLLRPGDTPGPAGALLLDWRRATSRPVRLMTRAKLPTDQAARDATPVARAAQVLEAAIAEAPKAETAALIRADAELARAMGWQHVVPILGASLSGRALRQSGADLLLRCHMAVRQGAGEAYRQAQELTRAAQALRAVAPKLRSRASAQAVEIFLSRDAVSPGGTLSGLMSDRAARRFCDRLVELGVARELTGRSTFRLYGI